MNTSALTHTGVHSSIHIGVKNRCSQTHIVLICCLLQNLFCNISYVCCSITLTFRIYCDSYRCWLLLQSPWCCSSVVFFCVFLFLSAGIEANCLFFCFLFFFFFFFFSPLSHYPPFSFFISLSPPSLLTFPAAFFFFLLSLSCFLCPLVLSIIVWLNKRVYKIKLIN